MNYLTIVNVANIFRGKETSRYKMWAVNVPCSRPWKYVLSHAAFSCLCFLSSWLQLLLLVVIWNQIMIWTILFLLYNWMGKSWGKILRSSPPSPSPPPLKKRRKEKKICCPDIDLNCSRHRWVSSFHIRVGTLVVTLENLSWRVNCIDKEKKEKKTKTLNAK